MAESHRVRDRIALLRATEFFQDLEDSALEELASACEPLELMRGQTLFREGEEGHSLFTLIYGRLGLFSGRRRVGVISSGECVGEMALLRDGKRSSTLVAERDCYLLRLEREAFQHVLEQHPRAILKLMVEATERMSKAARRPRRRPRSLVVAPQPGGGPEVDRFCALLQEALQATAPTGWFGPQDQVPELHWFDEQEGNFQQVIYQCHPELTPWSERCLRQADRLLVVGFGGEPRPLSPLERYWNDLQSPYTETSLILLSQRTPRGTERWLKGRGPLRIHHLQFGQPPYSLARFLNRRAVGLVLGGGGARGLAHIGVFKALEERNIEVDLLGGASMGGFAAALKASGRNARQVEADLRWAFIEAGSFLDYTFPFYSLIKGQRMLSRIKELFGTAHIEDLPTPFFCMSSDISNARQVIHDRGPLARWLAVGMSIPGMAPPYPCEGRLLVDGGLLNNLPVDIAADYDCDPVVAVNVDPKDEFRIEDDAFEGGFWSHLWRHLSGSSRAPNLFELMVRVTTLSSAASVERLRDGIHHYIQPETGRYGLFDFDHADEIIEAGYRAMMAYKF